MLSGIYGSNPGFLAGLEQIQNRITQTNEQITSGSRVNVASDNPGAVSQILGYQQQIDHINQVQANLNIASLNAKTADGALQSASQLLDKLVSIATQGASTDVLGSITNNSSYVVDSAQAFTPLSNAGTTPDTETLTFTSGSNTATVTLTPATASNLQQAISTINTALTASGIGISAVASANTPGAIAFQSSSNFSIGDQLTGGAGGGGSEGVFHQTVTAGNSTTLTLSAAPPIAINSSTVNLAQQVQEIQQQLVSLANTSVNGQYVFGGDNATAAPYTYTGSGWGVSANYAGSTQSNTMTISDANGQTMIPGVSAQAAFDNPPAPAPSTTNPIPTAPPAGNVFAAVGYLKIALQNNDKAGLATATSLLQSALTQIGEASMKIGATENWIDQASTAASQSLTNIQQQLSSVRDTDIPTAATQLTMDQTALQAAISAHASLSNKSLFDYLG